MATKKTASEGEAKHPDRTHESNLVEVESMPFTRIVDGHRYGPFGPDDPKERRMVPEALAVTFMLPVKGAKKSDKAEMIDTGTDGERLSGVEQPVPVEGQVPLSDEEKEEAAEAAGLSQDDQLAKREHRLGARADAEPRPAKKK